MKKVEVFNKCIDRVTDVFMILQADGKFTYASNSISEQLGFTSNEVLNKSYPDLIHPDEIDFAVSKFIELVSYPGNRVVMDLQIRTAHDSYRWMECIMLNMLNIPQVSGVLLQIRDVSERKIMELRVEESDMQFRSFMNHLPAATWVRDEQGKYVFVNKVFIEAAGKPESEILGKTPMELFPEMRSNILDSDQLSNSSGKKTEYLEQIVGSDGSVSEWIISKFPIERSNGKTFIGGFGFNISALKKTEERLKDAEQGFLTIFEHSPDAIFIEDEQGNILNANRKACEIQGVSKNRLIGKNILDLTPDSKKSTVKKQFDQMWVGNIPSLISYTWSNYGEEIPVEIHSGRIIYNGKPALILTLRDIRVTREMEMRINMN